MNADTFVGTVGIIGLSVKSLYEPDVATVAKSAELALSGIAISNASTSASIACSAALARFSSDAILCVNAEKSPPDAASNVSILSCKSFSANCARVTSFVIAVVFACSAACALASSASILPCNVASAALALVASVDILCCNVASTP